MTKTITIQDSTAADISAALAAPITPPAPTPTPTPSATSNLVVLETGTDGDNAFASYDPTLKATRITARCYQKGNTAGGYPGCFTIYQVMNNVGKWFDVGINGGLIDGTPGKEQVNFDFVGPVDGVQANVSIVGRSASGPPMFGCWPAVFYLGSNTNRWLGIWLSEVPTRPGQIGPNPAGVIGWVSCNGGWLPRYA